ncbi:MAG: dipeptide epimerase [Cystobacter sp.]
MPLPLDVRVLELPLRDPWTIARGTSTSKRNVIVELRVDGVVGRGEAAPNVRYGESADTVTEALRRLAPSLDGDPWHFRVLSERVDAALSGHPSAKAAVDLALHDLAARRLGVPFYRMLGLDPKRMPLTSFSIGIDDPQVLARKVRDAQAYPVLKVKLGATAVRETFGAVRAVTPKPIWVDANEAWKPDEALRHIEWLAERGVELVEQPLPAADVEGAKWLRQRSPLPLVADEALMAASDVPRLAEGYHGINVKLQKCGGIREALRIIETARACGLKVMLGCMVETSVGIAAGAHLGPLADWLDLDGNLLLAEDPFLGHPVVEGRIQLGDGPGFGVEPRPLAGGEQRS